MKNITVSIKDYLKDFNEYVNINEKSYQAEKDMIEIARKVENLVDKAMNIQKKQKEELINENAPLEKIINKIDKLAGTTVDLVAIIVRFICIFIGKNIVKVIDIFQEGLIDFFKYINRQSNEAKLIDLNSNKRCIK